MAKRATQPERQFAQADAERLHRRLEQDFAEILGGRVSIRDGTQDKAEKREWRRIPVDEDSPIIYEMKHHPSNANFAIEGTRLVFPLTSPDTNGDMAWVGWSDAWVKRSKGDECVLKSAGMRFHWGRQGDSERRVLIFRAEWDEVISGQRNTAGQPHWHVDRKFLLARGPYLAPESEPIDLDGSSPVSPAPRATELKDVHLAMAGWSNLGNRTDLTGWQCQLKEWQEVADWAKETLLYMREQLSRIRPARPLDDMAAEPQSLE